MLFNSIEFLIFFPIVTLTYFLFNTRFRWVPLLVASCTFYMFFIPEYILILAFTIVIDYCAGILIENSRGKRRKVFLIISIIANVGILAFFKYYNFFIENINHLTDRPYLPFLQIILPIGLSFHTFQAMSYTIEVYRGNQKAERHFGIYSLYVLFYPQLVAGPIERPQNILPQFRIHHSFSIDLLFQGLRLMLWGLFKKVVVADRLSIYVDAIYASPEEYSNFLNIFIALIFFSVQIYCDFSGYSDIAIGSAKTMGFDLMVNFNRPYFSKSIKEFWSKWHISLSTWFRDYVYIPLGGNRVKTSRLYINTIIVFLLSGFWHGASWTFVVWGMLHALFIIINSTLGRHIFKRENGISTFTSFMITFSAVTVAWVFFRADSFDDAFFLLKNFFSFNTSKPFSSVVAINNIEFGTSSILISFFVIAFTMIFERYSSSTLSEFNHKRTTDVVMCIVILVLIVSLGVFQRNSFIYFQF